MKKRKISIPIVLGICLIFISLCFLVIFHITMKSGVIRSQKTTEQIAALLPERTQGIADDYRDTPMPVLGIDGVDYVAMLEIPAFDVKIPVADQWNGKVLSSTVERFWGSVYDGSFVIGGPDYPGMFDFCDEIDIGTRVTVMDMTGTQFSYTVFRVDRADRAETQWLTDEECDLTLFRRDMYSMGYIAVRCVLAN